MALLVRRLTPLARDWEGGTILFAEHVDGYQICSIVPDNLAHDEHGALGAHGVAHERNARKPKRLELMIYIPSFEMISVNVTLTMTCASLSQNRVRRIGSAALLTRQRAKRQG